MNDDNFVRLNQAISVFVGHGQLPESHPERVVELVGEAEATGLIARIEHLSGQLYDTARAGPALSNAHSPAIQESQNLTANLAAGKELLKHDYPGLTDQALDELAYLVSYDLFRA